MGFGFLNSFFLFALAAMALPIIIHILNRRRLKKVPFSSLEFIFEMSKRRMSKINFRRWLILLLRTLAIILLVLAFARPTLRSDAALFAPGEAPKNVVICIDASSSMQAELETGTAFTAAKDIALQIVDESGKNDVINVIPFAAREEPLFANGTRNKQIVRSAIDSQSASNEVSDIGATVAMALELVAHSDVTGGEVYVISDFRATDDSTRVGDVPEDVRVLYLPVYPGAIDNVSIDRVFTPRKLIRPGEVVRVGVTVTNHSQENPASFPLELHVAGNRKAEKVVNLSPAASATINFAVSLNTWGLHECRVSKNHDRLPIDDDRYFLIEVSKQIPVTLVRGQKFIEDNKVASYFYVDKALNPRGSGEGEFAVTTVDEKALTAKSLPQRGVVVWTDPTGLDRRRLDLLKRHIHGGGSALVFLGQDRRGMWRDDDFVAYLGANKAVLEERDSGEHFATFLQTHPVFELFSEEELELLSTSKVNRFVRAAGVSPDSVIAYLGTGDPGMWEVQRGDGRIVVFAVSPDLSAGQLVLSPMFLPLVHTTVSYLASAQGVGFHSENFAGEDLFFDLPPGWGGQESSLRVTNNAGVDSRAVLYESPRGDMRAMTPRPQAVGFYKLVSDSSVVAQSTVNLNTKESNLNPRVLGAEQLGDARLIDTTGDLSHSLQQERQGREIYAVFVMLAMAALVTESILGRKA